MKVRLGAYLPGGGLLGWLPAPLSWSAAFPYNDVGALSLRYSTLAAGGEYLRRGLTDGLEVGLELVHGSGWHTPWGARFPLVQKKADLSDLTATVDLTLPSFGWMLGKISHYTDASNLLPADAPLNPGQRKYNSSPGGVLLKLWQEYVGRSDQPMPLGVTLSATIDSAGAAWGPGVDHYLPLGVTILAHLQAMVEGDLCDWATDGRELRVWKPDSQARDFANSVRLRLGRELRDAPSDESLEGLAARVIGLGDGGRAVLAYASMPVRPWGDWEATVSMGGGDESTLLDMTNAAAGKRSTMRAEYTRTLTMDPVGPQPMLDYRPGDWVSATGTDGQLQRMRVQQVTLSGDGSGEVTGSVILNDRIIPSELRRARASNPGGLPINNVTPTPLPSKPRPAAQPLDFAATSELVLNDRTYSARVRATCSTVTTDVDGRLIGGTEYELWARAHGVAGSEWRLVTRSPAPVMVWEPVVPGTSWDLRCRAALPSVSGWSQEILHTVAQDTGAPLQPAAPAVSPVPAGLQVVVSGKDSTDGAMPADFRETEVHVGATSGFTPSASTLKGAVSSRSGGSLLVTPLTNGTTYWVRLVAVDLAGNRSTPSAAKSGTPASLVDDAALRGELDAAQAERTQLRTDLTAAHSLASQATTSAQTAFNQSVSAWDKALASAQSGGGLVLNGGFEQVDAAGNPVEWLAPTSTVTYPTGMARTGGLCTRVAGVSTTVSATPASFAPTSTGRSYYIEAWAKLAASAPESTVVQFSPQVKTAAGGTASIFNIGQVAASSLSTTAWTKVSATWKVATADAVGWRPRLWASVGVDVLWDDVLAVDVTEAEAARATAEAAQSAASTASSDAAAAKAAAASAVTSTVIQYATSTSPTVAPSAGWSTTTPTYVAGQYTWVRTTITYGDGTITTTAPALLTGPRGADGTSVNIRGQVASSAALPTSGNTAGDGYITTDTGHLWVWAGTAWTDAGLVRGPQGEQGQPGPQGVSVVSVAPFYRTTAVNATAPIQPTGTADPAGWTKTEPGYVAGTALWRADRIMLSNGTAVWTPVTKVSAYAAAAMALTSANGRNSVIHSTLAPSGTTNPKTGLPNVEGDVWWRWDSEATRNVIGQWFWIDGAWVASTINHQVISSVDVNKLVVTGSAKMSQAVIDKLWADVVLSRKIITDMLVVTGSNRLPSGPADTWPFRRVAASTSALDTEMNPSADTPGYTVKSHQYVTSTVATGSSSYVSVLNLWDQAANQYVPIEPGVRMRASIRVRAGGTYPEGMPRVRLAFWWRGADGASVGSVGGPNQALTWTWDELVMEATAPANAVGMYVTVQTNGPGVIRVGVPSLLPMDAGNLIVDGAIRGRHVLANEITVDKLGAGAINSGSHIIAGDPGGYHAKLDSSGFRSYVPDRDGDSVPDVAVRLGTGDADVLGLYGPDGSNVASIAEDGTAGFRHVSTESLSVGGDMLPELLDERARGVVARASRGTDFALGTWADVFQFSAQVRKDRLYRLAYRFSARTTTAGARAEFRLRRGSGHDLHGSFSVPPTGIAEETTWEEFVAFPSDSIQTWVAAAAIGNGSGITMTGSSRATLEDVGPWRPDTGQPYVVGQEPAGSYTSEWVATSTYTYTGAGSERTDLRNKELRQGHSSDFYSVANFTGGAVVGEVGKTISQALTGATIRRMQVYLYASFWYWNKGGTAVLRLGSLSATPTLSAGWPKPGGRWVDVSPSLMGSGTTTLYTGKTSTASVNSLEGYGAFHGVQAGQNPPRFRVFYSR